MAIVDDLDRKWTDHVYETIVKPRVGRADRAMASGAPVRGGSLKANTGAGLSSKSDPDTARVWFYSDPPRQTPNYNTFTKSFGNRDHANFSNRRGSSAGWFDKAVNAASAFFR